MGPVGSEASGGQEEVWLDLQQRTKTQRPELCLCVCVNNNKQWWEISLCSVPSIHILIPTCNASAPEAFTQSVRSSFVDPTLEQD